MLLTNLSTDDLLCVLRFASAPELARCRQTCSTLKLEAESEDLWERHCGEAGTLLSYATCNKHVAMRMRRVDGLYCVGWMNSTVCSRQVLLKYRSREICQGTAPP